MLYYSTRDKSNKVTLSEAISLGLAKDGGLFMPERFPIIDVNKLDPKQNYKEFASVILKDYFVGDKLESHLTTICHNAFKFPVPLSKIDENTELLELFHGQTLSFKDFGASFLAECLNVLSVDKKITIMVATSGDTGSAVASAFYGKDNVNIVVLFPKDKISKRQEKQITCYDGNVLALEVNGTFDSCQKIVKESFSDDFWQNIMHISSANSINLGRLLPQLTYYAYTSYHAYVKTGKKSNFVIPTGNLGNATAAYFAKKMGFPIGKIVLATNANKVIVDYRNTGEFKPSQSVETLANAMDVGNPSNFERLHDLFPDFNEFCKNVNAYSVSDEQIRETIKDMYTNHQIVICPHTATGVFVRKHILAKNNGINESWIIAATAHPCKFETIIEPILNIKISVPESLDKILHKPSKAINVDPTLAAVTKQVKLLRRSPDQ